MILELFKFILFPKFCFGCNRFGSYLCKKCSKTLPPVREDIPQNISGLDGLISFFEYKVLVKKIIVRIKYYLVYDAISDLLNATSPPSMQKVMDLKNTFPEIVLIPVPLHAKRKRDRGFNQSEKMFNFVSKKVGIPMVTNIVYRAKFTPPQANMVSKSDRAKNIIGAFSVTKNIIGKDVIICDDVWTTGATLRELGRELKKNGARNVFALTIARVSL